MYGDRYFSSTFKNILEPFRKSIHAVYTENVCHIWGLKDLFYVFEKFFMLTKTALLDQNREKQQYWEILFPFKITVFYFLYFVK